MDTNGNSALAVRRYYQPAETISDALVDVLWALLTDTLGDAKTPPDLMPAPSCFNGRNE